MILKDLYQNKDFEKCLKRFVRIRRLHSLDDFKQDVFTEILFEGKAGDISPEEAKKIADKVAQRIKENEINNKAFSLRDNDEDTLSPLYNADLDYDPDPDSVLWEDNHVFA